MLAISPYLDPTQWTSNDWDDVRDWLIAIGTVGAAALALAFGLGLKEWIFRSKLRLQFTPGSVSDQVETVALVLASLPGDEPWEERRLVRQEAAYCRMRIENRGRSTAKAVSVSVLFVESWSSDDAGWTRARPELDGRRLIWSNTNHLESVDIAPGTERHFDLFEIPRDLRNQGRIPIRLAIHTDRVPVSRADVLAPGSWRVGLEISSDNTEAFRAYVAFRFDGAWPGMPLEGRIWEAVAVTGPTSTPPHEAPRPQIRDAAEMIAEAAEADQRTDP